MHEPDDREWLEQVRSEYQKQASDEPGRCQALIERLAREPAPARTRFNLFGWLGRQPLSLQGAIAGVVLLLAAAGGIGTLRGLERRAAPSASATPAAAPATGDGAVTFALRAPRVSSVAVVGDFNSWDPRATPMRRQGQGDVWTARVDLSAGLHSYAYVIDGAQWEPDPGAPLSAEAPFGKRSSIIVVGEGL